MSIHEIDQDIYKLPTWAKEISVSRKNLGTGGGALLLPPRNVLANRTTELGLIL